MAHSDVNCHEKGCSTTWRKRSNGTVRLLNKNLLIDVSVSSVFLFSVDLGLWYCNHKLSGVIKSAYLNGGRYQVFDELIKLFIDSWHLDLNTDSKCV